MFTTKKKSFKNFQKKVSFSTKKESYKKMNYLETSGEESENKLPETKLPIRLIDFVHLYIYMK